jgi:hypothetical protein
LVGGTEAPPQTPEVIAVSNARRTFWRNQMGLPSGHLERCRQHEEEGEEALIHTQKATDTPQDNLRADIRRIQAAGVDLETCEFIEELLRLDALEWSWDEAQGRPIRKWTVASQAHGVIMLPAAGEIEQLLMELVLDGEVAFSTDIDPPGIRFAASKIKAPVC